jgi:hypothetical protein
MQRGDARRQRGGPECSGLRLSHVEILFSFQIIFDPAKFVFAGPSWPDSWDAPASRKLCDWPAGPSQSEKEVTKRKFSQNPEGGTRSWTVEMFD